MRVLSRLLMVPLLLVGVLAKPAAAAVSISGEGSSFVLIEVDQWRSDVSRPPLELTVNYTATSSGQGRFNFADSGRTIDFALSDIPYVGSFLPPKFPFSYVPISAGGMAFMFNLKDAAGRRILNLKLTPETACKIFTDQIKKWDDPLLLAQNPSLSGVKKKNIKLVVRSGAAGTSYILGQYCIATAPDVWKRFQTDSASFTGVPPDGYEGSPGPPLSQWPFNQFSGAVNGGGSDGNADIVASDATGESSVALVETGFAKNRKFPVASVKNAAGLFVQPTDSAVTAALKYASGDATGTQILDFVTPDNNAYNPSTYSYALVPTSTAGIDAAKGAVLAKFLNYSVGAGQESAEVLGYAPLPQNLVDLAFNLIATIPGAPPKESYTAVPPRAAPVVEPEQPEPNAGGGGGGGDNGGTGGATGGGGTGGGSGTGSADQPGAGTDSAADGGGTQSSGGATASGGTPAAGTNTGGTNDPAATPTPGATPAAGAGGATTVATVKGNIVTNAKSAVTTKTGSGPASGGGSQVAAGVFVEQPSERPVDKESSVPLAWVLALGAAGYLLARRNRKVPAL